MTRERLENQLQDAQADSRETQPRLDVLRPANEHLREIDLRLPATIDNDHPNGEVLSQAAQQAFVSGSLGQVVRSHYTLAAQLNQAVQALEGAEQNCAAAATTAAQHLAQKEAELAAAKAEAATLRESLQRHLASADDRAADAEAAAERLTQRAVEIARAFEAHQNLERRFSAAVVLLQEQDADLEKTNKQLTKREAEIAEANEARLSLERQLAEAKSALGETVRRSVDDRSTAIEQAAQRQSEFETALREKVARHDALTQDLLTTRQELAHAHTTLQEAEARHASAMTTAAAQREELVARHDALMAQAAAARDAVSRQLHEARAALESARQDHLANATTASELFAQQEAKLREAAERDAEFAARFHQEAATRETLELALTAASNKVAEAEIAIRDAEHRHASHITTITARFGDQQVQYETRLAEAAAARDLVDQRLREVEASFARSRHEAAGEAAAAAERLARLEVLRVEAIANLQRLEEQLADANAARHAAEQSVATERLTAERHAAQRQAEFEAAIAREAAGRHGVEQDLATSQQKLADSESARRTAEQHHASAMASAAAQFEATIARETAGRQTVEQDFATSQQKLADSESALRDAEQRHASATTSAAAQFAERQTDLETRLSHAASAHWALEQALHDAEQRHASEMKTAAGQFAERQRAFETLLAQTTAARDSSDVRLRDAQATLERIHDERAEEAIEVAEQRTQLESELATAKANGETLERRLAEVMNALHTAEELVVGERVASAERATARQMEFDARLSLELGTRNTIEQALAATRQDLQQTEAALRDALAQHAREMTTASDELSAQQRHYTMRLTQASVEHAALEQKLANADQRHASALKAAAAQLADQQTKHETRLAEVTTAREIISQQLHDTETALARVRQENDANTLASAEQLERRESELAALAAARQVLEGRLAETETALKNAEAQALAERTATLQQSAQRQAEFDAELARELEARTVVERDLAENRAAAEHTRQALLGQSAALTTEMRELEARLTQELARECADYEGKLADLETQLRALNSERDGLRQSIRASQAQLESLTRVHEDAKEHFERIRQTKEIELQRLGDDHAAVRHTLEQVRADALQTLERLENDHAAELLRFNAAVAERDAQITEQTARHAASQEAAQQAIEKLENELRAAVTAHRQQVEQLEGGLKAVTQDFQETRSRRDALQIEADRVPHLTKQLEAIRAESRRQFDGNPIGVLRCTGAGAIKDANRALITTLGYRTVDELQALGSAASVFESPDDFRWFIETCETPSESIDWIWKKKDGSRLNMRLRALRLSDDVVDIVAEDVTTVRAVEERLRRAQRMEAVGRLASEVAHACDILLRNVSQETEQWLTTAGSNTPQHHQGELILGDVTRAAGFLRQLSAYGEKQTSALAGVELNAVLRDLTPVLKRLAGDDIQLVLPKKAVALKVEVDAEQVERIFVNIVAYGRARLPLSGRLIIELGQVVVDRDLMTKYPNVRQGAHALIRVATVRTATPVERPTGMREPVDATAIPGVDLGVLQTLIDDYGGHLWMNAEPGGDMELKIHLPLREADTSKTVGVLRSGVRAVSTWLQS